MATEQIGVGGAGPELRQTVKGRKPVVKAPVGRKTPMKTTFPPAAPKPGSGGKTGRPGMKAATLFGAIKGGKPGSGGKAGQSR